MRITYRKIVKLNNLLIRVTIKIVKGNIAIIVPPGTSTLHPSYSGCLERGWLQPGVTVLLLGKSSKAGYRKVMVQGVILEIREDSFYCLERSNDDFEPQSGGGKEL